MNKIKISVLSLLLFCGVFMMSSCGKDVQKEDLVTSGTTFLLGSEINSEISGEIPVDGVWQVTDASEWLEISPSSGGGNAVVTIKALSENESIYEKEGEFILNTSTGEIKCYVYQNGRKGFVVQDELWPYTSGGQSAVEVQCNVGYSVSVDAAWMKLESVDYLGKDRLLSDGKTYSQVEASQALFSVEPNPGNARHCEVVFSSEDLTDTMYVTQNAEGEIEWGKSFYRQTSIIRMTGTGCQWCPDMAEAIGDAEELRPDRIVTVNSYGAYFSIPPGLESPISGELEKYFMTTGYPSAYVNGIAQIPYMDFSLMADVFCDMVDEAVESYPSRTGIAVTASLTGDKVGVSLDLAFREAGEYSVAVYLCENGIVHPQTTHSGDVDDYVHDGVIRAAFTDIFGTPVSVTEDHTLKSMEVEGTLPDEVDPANAYVVVFVYYPGGPEVTGVKEISYADFGNVLDNIVEIPLGQSVGYKYEE